MRDAKMRRGSKAVAGMALTVVAHVVLAQAIIPTRVQGTVISSTGERVTGAQVRVMGSVNQPATSDDDGRFDLNVLGDSTPRLVVRRIGFKPETLQVRLPQQPTPPLMVHLARVAQMIAGVVVKGEGGESNIRMAEVRDRVRTGGNGHFLMREDFERFNPAKVTDVLRRVPGLLITRDPRNSSFNQIRLRGSRCGPLFWMDGVPLLGIPFDPDQIPPQTIEAVEIYSAASLVPPQFQGPPNAQGCGSIVIWTRQGERRPRKGKVDADSIARLVDAARVFLASEVDTPAKITSIQEPEYPDSLRAAHVGGSAVIEFIVDAEGKIDKESIGIVSASHVRFGDAARVAALEATFVAAQRRGRPVAQVFHLPFTFTPPK